MDKDRIEKEEQDRLLEIEKEAEKFVIFVVMSFSLFSCISADHKWWIVIFVCLVVAPHIQ